MIITFEGVDGSGKTTLATKLFSVLKNKGYKVHYYKEDIVDSFSYSIRKFLQDQSISSEEKTFLFFTLRSHLVRNYLSELDGNYIILIDRFIDSTVVYDSLIEGIPLKIVEDINRYLLEKYKLVVEYTVIVDCDPNVVVERIENRSSKYLYDSTSLEQIQKIRSLFLSLPSMFKDRKYIILDNSTEDKLAENVIYLTELITREQN